MYKTTLILLLIFQSITMVFADGLALVHDDEDRLWLFNKGQFEQLEHNKVKQYHIGRNFCAYIDYLGNMKVWYNNELKTISESVNKFEATDDLMYWNIAGFLFVWQDGLKREISREAKFAKAKGQIIFFEDDFENALKIYYNFNVYTFAQNHYSLNTKGLSLGRNSVAVLDGNAQLFVFDRGQMQVKKFTSDQILFSAGGIGVLVKNEDNGELELITGESVETIDYFAPRFFKTEYNWVVWEDQSGNLNFWDGAQKNMLTYHKPSVLKFSPESLLYDNSKQLYLYSARGNNLVCHYIPESYSFYNDIFVFRNPQQQIELNHAGETRTLSSIPGTFSKLYYDVIVLSEGRKRMVYYNSKIYRL